VINTKLLNNNRPIHRCKYTFGFGLGHCRPYAIAPKEYNTPPNSIVFSKLSIPEAYIAGRPAIPIQPVNTYARAVNHFGAVGYEKET